ncbi:MAG: hypothetical protein VR76_02120 [Pseudomonas sp. BRH_c35]|nr:MAG: hypothetical protein VR76_02120 [Pseudomonas sp. BRH_c35]
MTEQEQARQDQEVEWFNEGFDAFQRGEDFDSRPDYASNPRRSTCWEQGGCVAQAEKKGSPFDLAADDRLYD